MKNSIVFVVVAFLYLVAFPTTIVGIHLKGWPNPFLNTVHSLSYGDSKIWKCTYSNGSAPAISISNPGSPTPLTPSTPLPTPKTSPPLPTPSPLPPAPKKSLPPPTPSLPPPTPKKSPSTTPTPTLPPPTPKKSPSPPSTPSLPPPTPKKSPSPPPSDDHSSTPSNPPSEHHHSHHHQNPWEHIESCIRNMGPVGMCQLQMEVSFHTRLFRVSNYCCNLVANMKNECDDVAWGFFTDPFFVPLVRVTCHVNY